MFCAEFFWGICTTAIYPCIATTLLLVAAWKLWHFYNVYNRDRSCPLPLPPGSMGLPIVGETLAFILGVNTFYQQRLNLYGPIYKTHILGNPTIRVIGAKHVKKILSSEHTLVTSHWPRSTRMIMGESALAHSTGDAHRKRRKAIQKAFTYEALSSYVLPIQREIRRIVHGWGQKGLIMGYPECKFLAFSTAAKNLLGFHAITDEESVEMMKIFSVFRDNLFSLPLLIRGFGLYKGMEARKYLIKRIDQCIKSKQADENENIHSNNNNNNDRMGDVLSFLMASEVKLNENEVVDTALELLFAGHETIASVACSLVLQLGRNPEVLSKVQDELSVHELLDPGSSYDLTLDKVNKLHYTGNVIKEVLRISPPIGAGFRKALKTFDIGGFQIPKGWSVVYSIRETHNIAEIFQTDDDFEPDRWDRIDDNKNDEYHRFHYVPFGSGSRGCAGKEFSRMLLKVFVVEIVRNCRWKLLNEAPDIKLLPVPHPVDKLPVEFMLRRPAKTPNGVTE